MKKLHAIAGREDLSRFIVHLTRDSRPDLGDDGGNAEANLRSILKSREIRAVRPHCLFNSRLDELSQRNRKLFNVCCFTETPLNQIHLLTREIQGRSTKLEPYGLCFRREFVARRGGQPAIYVNSYDASKELRTAADDLFDQLAVKRVVKGPAWRVLPFMNAMHEKYDFSWEREWRVRGSLNFVISDIVCLILPSDGAESLRDSAARNGVAVVSPGWTYDQIVAELAGQQRTTRKLWKAAES